MLTQTQLKQIETSGIIPDELLAEYLADKQTTFPDYGDIDASGGGERRFQTMYAEYKANMKKAQKESHKKRYT